MSTAITTAIRAAIALLTDEKARKKIGWIIVIILSPLILIIGLLCSLGSGSSSHNNAAIDTAFHNGVIPSDAPEEYQLYLREIQDSFRILDEYIAEANELMEEGNSLDADRIKAVFYALYFGVDSPSESAHRQFVDCFYTYEERTQTVTEPNEAGEEVEVEENYTVAVPTQNLGIVYGRITSTLGVVVTFEQRDNVDNIYKMLQSGWTGDADYGELGDPAVSVDGFCSPLGANWRSMVTSEFGYRICPYHGRELHSGLDMAAPEGTPIRAALSGTVVKSYYSNSYGNYTLIAHENGITTGYAHQSQRLVSVGDTVEAGDVIGLVGSTGDSTGPHLHLEVRVNNELQNPRNYLP